MVKPDVDQALHTEVPLVGLLKTHHDNQENILEMVPMSKSILDEKGKVPLQELSGKQKTMNKNHLTFQALWS